MISYIQINIKKINQTQKTHGYEVLKGWDLRVDLNGSRDGI